MVAAVDGELCPISGKIRMLDQRSAEQLRVVLAAKVNDPDRDRLETYPCACGDWHVGHR